eukprot:CAMPEP_0173313040 /NCGR_PEP_ID=MMETSP1143-20121109/24515_1 /TAXON_ID=483371 /ORGANISM="non described non described, Strain CCMP2298" /LENGTH=121 /DNA_ID=CAMNT_0014255399 /DNA_START=237 /DNA_END=599 /DNA_ORIENTATION=+
MSWISPQVGYLHLWLQVEAKGCFGGRSLKWQLLGVIRDGVLRQDDKDYQGGSIWGAGCTSANDLVPLPGQVLAALYVDTTVPQIMRPPTQSFHPLLMPSLQHIIPEIIDYAKSQGPCWCNT